MNEFLGDLNISIKKRSDLLIGIPYLNRSDLLVKSISSVFGKGDVLIINNSLNSLSINEINISQQNRNIGVAASWNLILRYAIKYNYNYVLITANDFFHKEGNIEFGLVDFINSDCILGHIDDYNSFLIRPSIVGVVGWFDENYYPGYCEDTDYTYRIFLSGNYKKNLYIGNNTPEHLRSQTVLSDKEIFSKFEYTYGYNKRYFKEKWGIWDNEMIDRYGNSLIDLFSKKNIDFCAWKNPRNDVSLNHKDWDAPIKKDIDVRDWSKIKSVVKENNSWILSWKGN